MPLRWAMPVAMDGAPVSPTRNSDLRILDFLRRRVAFASECNWRSAAEVSGGKGSVPPAIVACYGFLREFLSQGRVGLLRWWLEIGMREPA
jgi:hypothetical protein